jgi:hypothetical protein
MSEKKVPGWLGLLLVGGAFGALLWLERRRPLRRSVESKAVRTGRNLAVAGLSAAAIQLADKPVTAPLAALVDSIVRTETDSNWSSGLTLWDWLHGTLRLNVPQDDITIGVPAYRDPEEVRLPEVLAMPFGEQRPSWRLPGDGEPTRPPLPAPRDHWLA